MRLDSVRETLARNVDRLAIEAHAVDNKNIKLSSFMQAIEAIWEIRETGMFQELCRELLRQEVISLAAREPIVVSADVNTQFSARLNNLRTRVRYVLDALSEFVELVPEDCIRVKLPETSDLESAAKVVLEIDKLLNQMVANEYVEGRVALHGFSQGSLWVDICLGSIPAYHLIAGLVRLYFDIRQRQTQQGAREQMLHDLTLAIEIREAVAKAIKGDIENYRRHKIKELLAESNIPSSDHEFALRVENSLRVLGNLLERGLEIHPSLMAPIKERNLLPDPKRILDAIKSLPSGYEDKSQNET